MNYKLDQGKPRLDLVPPAIIEAVGTIRTYGIEKYGDDTWDKVEPERYRAALMRHLCEYLRNPNSVDGESGLPHLWHMACNVAFLCELDFKKPVDNVLSPEFWERFKAGNIAVNCETEDEAEKFVKLIQERDIEWQCDEETHWADSKHTYRYEDNLKYLWFSDVDYYVRNNYEVVKFSDIIGGN